VPGDVQRVGDGTGRRTAEHKPRHLDLARGEPVRGWALQNGSDTRTAITLEPARGPELAELLAEAYGLTARERRVSNLVAQGLPNAAIAARLYLSIYTVQDHLKAIFEKLGVSNRGQLVARLFLAQQSD